MILGVKVVLLLLKCVMLTAAPCTTTAACQCVVDKLDSANRDVYIVVPWSYNECNQCQLVDTVNECAPETAMHMRTVQYGFWAPFNADINASTIAVIKVKRPGDDVVNKHLIIRGFDTPNMQGCGRKRFPNASSSVNSADWASNTATTKWSWNAMYAYNIGLETSCARDDKIWFYNANLRVSNDEVANGVELQFEFNINNVMYIATNTQSLRINEENGGTTSASGQDVYQIHQSGYIPKVLTIMPVLYRLVCSVNETSCPDEWSWHTKFHSHCKPTCTRLA